MSNSAEIIPENQQSYWDSLSGYYHEITRISVGDFHYGPQIPGERKLRLLPRIWPGMTALELGCGAAQNSIWLSKRGAVCVAADISPQQLARAAALAEREKAKVELLEASLEKFHLKLRGRTFDLVHSSHALEFARRPDRVVRKMSEFLNPGGTLMVSTVHPLYNGSWVEGMVEDDSGTVFDGQFLTDYFNPPDDVRDDIYGRVVSRAYPVSDWFRWLRAAGLEVTAIAEPPAVVDAPYTSDYWADHGGQLDHIPSTLIMVARK